MSIAIEPDVPYASVRAEHHLHGKLDIGPFDFNSRINFGRFHIRIVCIPLPIPFLALSIDLDKADLLIAADLVQCEATGVGIISAPCAA
jgi:hypothetical protein